MKNAQNWFVYIVQTACDKLYTGISTDVDRRFQEHLDVYNGSKSKGAKFFRGHRPIEVVYTEMCNSRSQASKREYQIKLMSKQAKISLLEGWSV